MKRAALLFLTIGAPLALLLFPSLRHAMRRKARALLLLYVAFILGAGFFARRAAQDASSPTAGQTAMTLLGTGVIVVAFASVLREALRDQKE